MKPVTEAEFDAAEKRVMVLVDKWVKLVGLGYWHFNIAMMRERIYKGDDSKNGMESLFRISPRWFYSWARLEVSLLAVHDEKDDVFLERCFIHELMHCFLNEVRPEEYDTRPSDEHWLVHEEHAAESLAKAFQWVAQFYEGKLEGLTRSEIEVESEPERGYIPYIPDRPEPAPLHP